RAARWRHAKPTRARRGGEDESGSHRRQTHHLRRGWGSAGRGREGERRGRRQERGGHVQYPSNTVGPFVGDIECADGVECQPGVPFPATVEIIPPDTLRIPWPSAM